MAKKKKSQEMNKVFFKGYYGFENLGDDIFVKAIDWYCAKDGLVPLYSGYKLPKGSAGKNVSTRLQKHFEDIKNAINSSKIVLWGGSTLYKINRRDLIYYLYRFKTLRNKMHCFGISIGPFPNEKNQKDILKFLKYFNFIGIRDNEKEIGFKFDFTFDIAILTPLIFNLEKKERNLTQKYNVILNVSAAPNEKEYISEYIDFVRKNIGNIDTIKIIIFNPDDYDISHSVYNILTEDFCNIELINYTYDTEYMVKEIKKGDVLLGNRLHSGILAYSLNIPFVLNEYHEKCSDFLNTINQKVKVNELNSISTIQELIEQNKCLVSSEKMLEISLEKLNVLTTYLKKKNNKLE